MSAAADHQVSRRTLVAGAALGLLSGCQGDDSPPRAGRRRRRRRRQARSEGASVGRRSGATVLTQADLDEVAARLTDLVAGDDLAAFLDYARPSDGALWRRMWAGLHEVPTTDRRFHLQAAAGQWRNRTGGPVTVSVRGAVSYRIEGCDAESMAHLCDLSLFKAADGGVRVQSLGALRDEGAAPWLLSEVAVLTAPHVVLISRAVDAATARGLLGEVERGAARALAFVAPPDGVSKVCVTLGWPEARDVLFGGTGTEFVGSAHRYRYVDPQVLADTGRRRSPQSFEGSRVVVEPGATAGQGAEAVTAHEVIHAMAFQWGPSAPPLYAEGLARWFEAGPDEVERAARRIGVEGYRAFAARITERPGRAAFYDPAWQEANYTCAAATCAHVARAHGEGTLRALVRTAYEGVPDPARRVLGMSERALLREVAAGLERPSGGAS